MRKPLAGVGLVAAVGVLIGIGMFAGAVSGSAPGEDRAYGFDGLRVTREQDPNTGRSEQARVTFAPRWMSDDFPGTRPCTWTVRDGEGTVLAQATANLTAMAPTTSDVYKEMDIPSGSMPASASVVCGERLDDPSGSYSISNIRLSQPSRLGADIDVSFNHTWNGSGLPTPQTCVITITDSGGNAMFSNKRGFFAAGTEPQEGAFPVEAPPEAKQRLSEADSASISCSRI
jgi:hypothetical protein